ncbi:MAG: hypothetical protein A2X85_17385 [Geobacteraceae bacterium GWF2_54_21]|nr:MAG: hypothetical protein A2X85_17385 [Geobacteraceae bacterium GWF2_54_21]
MNNSKKTRSPEVIAKILRLIYCKSFEGYTFSMFQMEPSELASLAGVEKITDNDVKAINKQLKNYDFVLVQLFDCFVVTEAPEIDLLRSVPSKLLKKYQIGSDDSIESEFAAEMSHKWGFGYGDDRNYN